MDFSSYRKLGESDLLILKVSIDEMLSVRASPIGSSATI